MKQNTKRALSLVTALSLLLGLAAGCSSKAEAATMHLRRAEGTVGVSDGEGRGLEPAENLGLFSGYGVDTKGASYAWIDLDEVKLTKMDENSQVEIKKEGKHLTIEVKSGSLFFNVTEPLADDETLDIRTSTMLVGIRGTCGWVEAPDGEHMNIYLLEGKVECAAGAETATVSAGEKAAMTADGEISVTEFTAFDIPGFVMEEVRDEDMAAAILDASGIDVLNPVDPQDEMDRKAALMEVLDNNSGASYAGLFDMDRDGREDLVLLYKVGEYAGFRWVAYLWDGSEIRAVNLTHSTIGPYTTDDLYTVVAGIYRERATGTPYVRYYGEVVGGAYSNYFVGVTDSIVIDAPFWGGGFDGTEEEYETWRQQKEQEQQEYEADLEARFEAVVELNVGGFPEAEDYTYTIGEIRQQLTPKAAAPEGSGGEDAYEINGTLELAEGTTRLRGEEIYQNVVVREGQYLECEGTTIYGSVRVEYGGNVYLSEESAIRGSAYAAFGGQIFLGNSTIRGELHLDGGAANVMNSTLEGDVYVRGYIADGLFYAGDFKLFESRAAKNIYVSGVDVGLERSTVDGYVDVNNEGFDNRGSGRYASIEKSTVNGQWYEKAAVVYEFNERAAYNRDDVTVIMGRTP